VFGVVCTETLGLTDFENTVCTAKVDSIAATVAQAALPASFVVAAGIAARQIRRPIVFHICWAAFIAVALLIVAWSIATD